MATLLQQNGRSFAVDIDPAFLANYDAAIAHYGQPA